MRRRPSIRRADVGHRRHAVALPAGDTDTVDGPTSGVAITGARADAQTRSRYMVRCGEAAIPVMERQPDPGSVTLLALEPDLMSLSGDESRSVGCSIARVDQSKLTGTLQ